MTSTQRTHVHLIKTEIFLVKLQLTGTDFKNSAGSSIWKTGNAHKK